MFKNSFKFIGISLLALWRSDALIPSRKTKLTPFERMKHLELIWQIREQTEVCAHICETCDSEGKLRCRFCGGTGFLMLGGELIGTNNDCPVCNGNGEEECKECMGAGNIVMWRKEYY
jgi:hypothetical protein